MGTTNISHAHGAIALQRHSSPDTYIRAEESLYMWESLRSTNKKTIKQRIAEHGSSIKCKITDYPVAAHFVEANHPNSSSNTQ
jgi:hypothetical protein